MQLQGKYGITWLLNICFSIRWRDVHDSYRG
jgi:hypothetical protein